MISALIKENRDLHRQIDKLSKQAVGAGSGIAERTLRSLQRRISGTVDGGGRAMAGARRRQHQRAGDVARSPIRNCLSVGAKR
jgi:hypothetical protein